MYDKLSQQQAYGSFVNYLQMVQALKFFGE